MFNRNSIQVNILLYFIVLWGYTFFSPHPFSMYITKAPVLVTIIGNTLWLLGNLIIKKDPN